LLRCNRTIPGVDWLQAGIAITARLGSVFRQLVVKGLVDVDYEGYGALKLNSCCRPLLRGETQIRLRKDLVKAKTKKTKVTRGDFSQHRDNVLWDALRAKRRELADVRQLRVLLLYFMNPLNNSQEFISI
jgi:superfamily II DNA helicase RecQ